MRTTRWVVTASAGLALPAPDRPYAGLMALFERAEKEGAAVSDAAE